MKNKYNAENIQVLEGLEAVRKRPGMYIGSTDIVGLHHLIWEVLDNSIDEVMSGFATEIKIILHPNNVISIEDNGRGIPVDKNSKTKLSGVETVFTILHAGGKFDSESYKVSGGLHGVGASVVNALSDWLICQVKRDNKLYEAKFKDGGKIDKKLKEIDSANTTGTKVIFHPDPLIFNNNEFNSTIIKDRIRESAFLFKNLKITFVDEINHTTDTFHYPEGIVDYVKYINHSKRTIAPIVAYSDTYNEIDVDVAFQYTDDMDEIIISFANSVKTFDGGSHVQGFKLALTNVINNYARNQKLLKDKDKSLEPEDIREGIVAVVSVKVPEKWINYEGQTKNKLNTQEANEAVKRISEKHIEFWLNEHKKEAAAIIEQAKRSRDARLEARKTREEKKKSKSKSSEKMISSKLTPPQSKDATKNELFLVEGDSAGGSAKLGRDKKYQAILPLRGKVMNVEKAKISDILNNEEIRTIISCLGCGYSKNIEIEKLKYDKIIIMTDADVDGSHIQVLLLTLFYKFLRPLIERGHVYIAMPPLYKIWNKHKHSDFAYAWDEEQLEQLKSKYSSYEIQRYKGLGEMNSDQLWETTMDPKTRTLLKVNIDDIVNSDLHVSILMGEDTSSRKDWINEKVNFEYDK